jgi:integrase/recombinase XerD
MTTIVTLSELKRDAESFLQFKRATGHSYKRGAFEVERFLRFVQQHCGEQDPISLAEAIQRWCGRLPATSLASFASFAFTAGVTIPSAMCPRTAERR